MKQVREGMTEHIVDVRDLKVHFEIRRSFLDTLLGRNKATVKAVDGVTFSLRRGEILSLVGESGSGKTTTGRAILNLVAKSGGEALFDGTSVSNRDREWNRMFRKKAQMIFQDPYQSLNPKDMIVDIVSEPLRIDGDHHDQEELLARTVEALEFAGLKPAETYLYKYPNELSGGQRQRVAIAAAFILSPDFIVADEPVSMLDASVRADILNLMVKMRETKNTSYLFITHDLSLAWLISDRVAIMYLGKIMEIGSHRIVAGSCVHPYSRALVDALPTMEEKPRERALLKGETPSPVKLPPGCRFSPRCSHVRPQCTREEPELRCVGEGHWAACHFAEEFLSKSGACDPVPLPGEENPSCAQ